MGGDGSERQTRAMVLERSVFFTMIIMKTVDGQQILSGMIRCQVAEYYEWY